jgi:hypothetical protein
MGVRVQAERIGLLRFPVVVSLELAASLIFFQCILSCIRTVSVCDFDT